MSDRQVPVTRDGLERLRAELQELKEVRRPAIVASLAEARSHGDLRENAGYDAARHDQAMTEKRIADLDALLRQAVIIESDAGDCRTWCRSARRWSWMLKATKSATPSSAPSRQTRHGLISNESPVGERSSVSDLGTRPSRPLHTAKRASACLASSGRQRQQRPLRRDPCKTRSTVSGKRSRSESTADGRHDTPHWRAHAGPYAACVIRVPADHSSPTRWTPRWLITTARRSPAPGSFLHVMLQELGFVLERPRQT